MSLACWVSSSLGQPAPTPSAPLASSPSVRDVVLAVIPWKLSDAAVEPPSRNMVAFVADKKFGGLRVMDVRLEGDVALAPVAPPPSHSLTPPMASFSRVQSSQAANHVTALTTSGKPGGVEPYALWVGWASGHVTLLNLRAAPDVEMPPHVAVGAATSARQRGDHSSASLSPAAGIRGLSSALGSRHGGRSSGSASSPAATATPRYKQWSDVVFSHRAAVHNLELVQGHVVSCSYDLSVLVWGIDRNRDTGPTAIQCRQIASVSGLLRTSPTYSLRETASNGTPLVHAMCRVCTELSVCVAGTGAAASDITTVSRVLWVGLEGGLHSVVSLCSDQGNPKSLSVADCVCFLGGDVTAAAALRVVCGADKEGSVVCRGDGKGRLWFTSLNFPSSRPVASAWSDKDAHELAAAALELHNDQDERPLGADGGAVAAALSLSLPIARPSQASVEVSTIVGIHSARVQSGGSSSPTDSSHRCFFAASIAAQYSIVVSACDVSAWSCGASVTDVSVVHRFELAAQAITRIRPMVLLSPSASSTSMGLCSLWMLVSARGEVSTLSAMLYDGHDETQPGEDLMPFSKSQHSSNVNAVDQRNALTRAMDVVHRAKQSVIIADACVEKLQLENKEMQQSLQAAVGNKLEADSEIQRTAKERDELQLALESAQNALDFYQKESADRQSVIQQLDLQLNQAAETTTTLRDALADASQRNEWADLRLKDCMDDLQREKGEREELIVQLAAAKESNAKLATQHNIFATRVMQLERQLADTEDHLKQQRDTVIKFSGIVDEQQDVIRDLHETHKRLEQEIVISSGEAHKWKREAERLQEKLQHSRIALDSLVQVWNTSDSTHDLQQSQQQHVLLHNASPPRVTGQHKSSSESHVTTSKTSPLSPWSEYARLRPSILVPPVRTVPSQAVNNNAAFNHPPTNLSGGDIEPSTTSATAHRGMSPTRLAFMDSTPTAAPHSK